MFGRSLSLALLSVAGLTHGLPTEKRQLSLPTVPDTGCTTVGIGFIGDEGSACMGPIDSTITIPKEKRAVFEECSTLDLTGIQAAYSALLEAYSSSPDIAAFMAMKPLHALLSSCGVIIQTRDQTDKRDTLSIPTATTTIDVSGLQAALGAMTSIETGSNPSLMSDIISSLISDTIAIYAGTTTIEISDRLTKRQGNLVALGDCGKSDIANMLAALAALDAAYGAHPPNSIVLLKQVLVTALLLCGQSVPGFPTPTDTIGIGPSATSTIGTDPVISGGPIKPEEPIKDGDIEPETPIEGGAIEPETPIQGGVLIPGMAKRDLCLIDTSGWTDFEVIRKLKEICGSGQGTDTKIIPKHKRQFTILPGGKTTIEIDSPDAESSIWPPKHKGKRQFSILPGDKTSIWPNKPDGSSTISPPKNKKRQIFSFLSDAKTTIEAETLDKTSSIWPRALKREAAALDPAGLQKAHQILMEAYGGADVKKDPLLLLGQEAVAAALEWLGCATEGFDAEDIFKIYGSTTTIGKAD